MVKLQYGALNKGIELEKRMVEQLEEYDEKVVDAMTNELEKLESEHADLIKNGNVRTDFNIIEYQENQKRLKELPQLISDLRRDKIKAIEDKSKLKDSLCKGIYTEIGDDYREEFNSNMENLKAEYDKALTKLIEVNKQMNVLEQDYQYGLENVIRTQGIYLTLDKAPYIYDVMRNHNLSEKVFFLNHAK